MNTSTDVPAELNFVKAGLLEPLPLEQLVPQAEDLQVALAQVVALAVRVAVPRPLPPPPASLPGDPLEVVVPVSFFLDGR